MQTFQIIALTPPNLINPSIAIAASRAGETGIIDLEYTYDEQAAFHSISQLVTYAEKGCGVKLSGREDRFVTNIISKLPEQITTVILVHADSETLSNHIQLLKHRNVTVLLEVTSLDQTFLGNKTGVDGFIIKGNEAGGRVSEETSFILLQQVLKNASLPVWVQGGIGLHTAAACYAAGAAGIVLDVQLALAKESALPEAVKTVISRMDGSENICIGSEVSEAYRVYNRSGISSVQELSGIVHALSSDSRSRSDILATWYQEIRNRVGWDSPDQNIWFLGQDASFAANLAQQFHTVGGILGGFRQAIVSHIQTAKMFSPLKQGSPLAQSHGTHYPIVQGPMARISDVPSFAASVAENGALPFLALAMLNAAEIKEILEETKNLLGNKPWGVGILGFVSPDLLQKQLDVVRVYKPSLALIAGGRPDQSRILEQDGIGTYLHVPSPGLLKMFIENGARRFILEGRECGGHIGPRSSFVLWNSAIDVLLESLHDKEMTNYCILFAGGIHDALSASMVTAMAAPLAERGIQIGVLLGTAYLFTEDALATNAINKDFQEVAIQCTKTAVVESGPGHATRCAITPYIKTFFQEKLRLTAEGRSAEEIRTLLEEMNLGRLRIASKGVIRNPQDRSDMNTPKYKILNSEEQYNQGMYMIGQLAALRDRVCTVTDLHHDISVRSTERLMQLAEPGITRISTSTKIKPSDVAIIGMACILPKAGDVKTYWENILNKVDAITEVPADRWDWKLYFDPHRDARDKIYSKWGGFIDPVPFDPVKYGMPPNSLSSIEPLQLLTLEVVQKAIEDAGYANRPFPREKTSVILGTSGGISDLGQLYTFRSSLPMFMDTIPPDTLARLPDWTEDSFAGILLNVTAGRVANRFNLGGANYTVDAACASSLAAVYLAVRELESETSDVVIVGGADTMQNPFSYLCFSKTQALSPRGRCKTFDENADGIVISEGVAILVLKRLADAKRDGDKIYAVIKAVSASSDGKAKGLTAPHPEGQSLALDRAYLKAGFSPATVELIEAHGTGTVAGDRAEIETLKRVFERAGAIPQSCAIGSVKSMIGHTKSTAGVASMIKIALSLYYKTLPPTIGIEKPNSILTGSPFYVNTEAHPWISRVADQPCRAGVSAFGFGGTNFHAVLEEHTENFPMPTFDSVLNHWPSELFLFAGNSQEDLVNTLEKLNHALSHSAKPNLNDLAYTIWKRFKESSSGLKLALVATSLDDLYQKLTLSIELLKRPDCNQIQDPKGIYFAGRSNIVSGKIAFLFPGQGSQYLDMLSDLAILFPEIREQFELANRTLATCFPKPLSSYIFPPSRFNKDEDRACLEALMKTNIAQPALGAAEMGLFYLIQALGLNPDMVAGHSYGEYVALCAAHVFSEEALYAISEARGRFIIEMAGQDLGAMAAVDAGPEAISEVLSSVKDIWIANLNAPRQTIVSGKRSSIEETIKCFEAQGMRARPIPVSCAFHSPLVASAQKRLTEFLKTITIAPPRLSVFSNTTSMPYPQDPEDITALLGKHLINPVKFVNEINAMYHDGARIFIEVGPRNILTSLTQQILEGQHFLAVALNVSGRSGILQLHHALGQLMAHGVHLQLDHLYKGRQVRQLKLDALIDETRSIPPSLTTFMVTGSRVYPFHRTTEMKPPIKSQTQEKVGNHKNIEHVMREVEKSMLMPDSTTANIETSPKIPESKPDYPGSSSFVSESAVSPHSQAALSMKPTASEEENHVMLQFQKLMGRFLETQQQVMQAYLQSPTGWQNPLSNSVFSTEPSDTTCVQTQNSVDSQLVETVLPPPQEFFQTKKEPVYSESSDIPARTEDSGQVNPISVQTPSSVVDKEQLTAQLLHTISERTGYPQEMLGLDLDIEADLGIDSIKRVEILGSVQRTYLSRYGSVNIAMEELTKIKTLRAIINYISAAVQSQSGEHTDKSVPEQRQITTNQTPSEEKQQPLLDRKQLTAQLLQVVSERTGYPQEVLGLDLDIEADLGIDSIKRVEILGALQRFYLSGDRQTSVDMEELVKIKTLQGIIDYMDAMSQSPLEDQTNIPVLKEQEIVQTHSNSNETDNKADVPRFLFASINTLLNKQQQQLTPNAVFIITDDEQGVALAFSDKINQLGGCAVLVRMGDETREVSSHLYTANLMNPTAVDELLILIRENYGSLAGIIHLLPLKLKTTLEEMDMESLKARLCLEIKSLFYLARAAGHDIRRTAEMGCSWLVAATGMGGVFASNTNEFTHFFPGQGSIAGLVKTLALEWPRVCCKVVHIDPKLSIPDAANYLFCEMTSGDTEVEVGYRDAQRLILRPKKALFDKDMQANLAIDSSWVILITGGAKGITAEVACALSKQYRPTLVLVGRSPLPAPHESPDTACLVSAQELKTALINRMRESGQRVIPAQVEAAYSRLMLEREMRNNLSAMQQAGSAVYYYQVDVLDEQALSNLIDEIYHSHGRLDGVIHGAGIIEDKLISDKSPDSFDRVFDTKVNSAFILSRKLRADSLKFLVFFSSMAGCFGNRGQGDYAAANEVMNKLAIYLDKQWPGRVVAINWGPWDRKGMVSVDVKRLFKERGVQLIPPLAGYRVFDEELKFGRKGEVEVVLGNGPWVDIGITPSSSDVDAFPFLNGSQLKMEDDGTIELVRTLDPSVDLYLHDHQLYGKPVLPMAVAMELMAEVIQQAYPDWEITGIQSLAIRKGIVIEGRSAQIHIAAKPRTSHSSSSKVLDIAVEITKLGQIHYPNYCATVQMERQLASPPSYNSDTLHKLNPFPMGVTDIYREWLFHGSCFHGISLIEGINQYGIRARLRTSSPDGFFHKQTRGKWLVDPVLIDSGLQLALLWARFHYNMTVLPTGFKLYRRFSSRIDTSVYCYLHASASMNGHIISTNIYFLNASGQIVALMEGVEASGSKDLNRVVGCAAPIREKKNEAS
ncbi:MAG: SDR family oxidoreductase [wastewater metagenome]|nr:SDR family oxidoreductase [Candidatus Loosdrechtia aerotolerans]